MGKPKKNTSIEEAAQKLLDFASDREDVKWLMKRLPPEANVNRTTVEYELQILKIIGVGWGLSYYLAGSPLKEPLSERFWSAIRQYAQKISTTTGYMTGQNIDYFQILKDRLDLYVNAVSDCPAAVDAAQVVGPEFARLCGDGDDLFAFMTGSKMFNNTLMRIRQYVAAIELCA